MKRLLSLLVLVGTVIFCGPTDGGAQTLEGEIKNLLSIVDSRPASTAFVDTTGALRVMTMGYTGYYVALEVSVLDSAFTFDSVQIILEYNSTDDNLSANWSPWDTIYKVDMSSTSYTRNIDTLKFGAQYFEDFVRARINFTDSTVGLDSTTTDTLYYGNTIVHKFNIIFSGFIE